MTQKKGKKQGTKLIQLAIQPVHMVSCWLTLFLCSKFETKLIYCLMVTISYISLFQPTTIKNNDFAKKTKLYI